MQLAAGTLPEDLTGFYAMLAASNPTEAEAAKARAEAAKIEAEAAAAAKGGGKKGDKGGKGKKDDKKGGKDAKGGKGKKGAAEPEEPPEEPPEVGGPSEWSKEMESLLRAYEATWVGRDERDNVSQVREERVRPARRPHPADGAAALRRGAGARGREAGRGRGAPQAGGREHL